MEALLKREPRLGLEYVSDRSVPEPGPGEILVEIGASAICGTDVHFYRWDDAASNFPLAFPRVLGHEGAGVVRGFGAGVTSFEKGDRVAFEPHIYCGECFACRSGDAHNCQHLEILGIDRDGVFATFAVVPARVSVPLPSGLPLQVGALLEPAGVGMHAVQRADIRPGDTVGVIGCGPIGLMAAQIALLAGAGRVLAVDLDPDRLEAARSLGAVPIDGGHADARAELLSASRRHGGLDVVIEASGVAAVYGWLFDTVRRQGTVVTVGHPGKAVTIDIARSINKRGLTLRGVFGRHLWDTWEAVLAMILAGRLDLERHITATYPLSRSREAFDRLGHGGVKVLFAPGA